MIYLGLHNSYQSGAAIFKDGVLIGAVTEERFNREKNYQGLPEKSIDYLLNVANINLTDVDKIVYGMVSSVMPDDLTLEKIVKRVADGCALSPEFKQKYYETVSYTHLTLPTTPYE